MKTNIQNEINSPQSNLRTLPTITTQQQQIQQGIITLKKEKLIKNIIMNKTINKVQRVDNLNLRHSGSNTLNINMGSNTSGRQGGFPSCVSHPCDVAKLEQLHENTNNVQNYNLNRRNSTYIDDSTMIICRICFQKDLTLISPCLYKGSLKFVHEDCLIQWLQTSNRKKCELCQTPFYIYKGRSSIKEFLLKIHKHFKEDKSRCVRLIIYILYLWLLKNRLFNLIRVYYNMVKQMKALWMLKGLYNAFIVMLVFQLATEEYARIKKIVQFIQSASVKYRVKGMKKNQQNED